MRILITTKEFNENNNNTINIGRFTYKQFYEWAKEILEDSYEFKEVQ